MFKKPKKNIGNELMINPLALLQRFCNFQRMKRRDYAELLSANENLQSVEDAKKTEEMVSAQIKTDFPEISDKSFELLVDATMHLIRKKQLKATDDICFK